MELSGSPIWPSAYRHGIPAADIRHVLRNFIATASDPADDGVTMFLGGDRKGALVEVGVLDTEDGPVVIHAMRGRLQRFFPRER